VGDLELRVLFRDSSWRWRLHATDAIELWTGPKLLGSIPGAMVADIFRDYLNRVALLSHFQARLVTSGDELGGAPDVLGPDRAERSRRRELRRARRGGISLPIALLMAALLGVGAGVMAHHLLTDPRTERAEATVRWRNP
jgi:hypothetical protein